MIKSVAAVLALVFAGGYFAGAFGPQAYTRTVSRPPAEVKAALERLDVTAQPGAPGSTAAAAGGIKPLFRLAEDGNRMTWFVMSGDKVATAMTAALEPVDSGKATRITTNVQRGDAPDDFVSPAFRSKGLTMALFGGAIESRINVLTQPAPASAETCRELFDRFAAENRTALPSRRREGMGDGLNAIMRLNAMEPELRRHGCNTNADGSFRSVEQRMADSDPNAAAAAGVVEPPSGSDTHVATRPGQPMLDPKPMR